MAPPAKTPRRASGPQSVVIDGIRHVRERGKKSRGLIPAAEFSWADHDYNGYLDSLELRSETAEKSVQIRRAMAASHDRRFNRMLANLHSHPHRKEPLALLANSAGISLREFKDFVVAAQKERAAELAVDGVVEITPDLIRTAKAQDAPCDRCDGFGWVDAEDGQPGTRKSKGAIPKTIRDCPACGGKGTRLAPGNQHAIDKLLEVSGLGGKGRGPAVQINQNFGSASMDSAVDQLNRVTFDVEAEEVTE